MTTARRSKIISSSIIVSAATLASRVLGLVRDVVFAHVFGSGGATDAFFLAFKIPNFLRRLFAEGAFSQAFVPVLAEYKEKGGIEAVRGLLGPVIYWLGFRLTLVTIVVIALAPYVALVFAVGYWWNGETAKLTQTGDMLRIIFPYLFLISFTALCGSVLNTFGKFAVPAITPVLLNLTLIFFALVVSPLMSQPIYALVWGVIVAGVLQFSFQLPFLAREKLLVLPRREPNNEGVRKIAKLMLPALFGVSVSQINLALDVMLATLLADGSVGWLYYSDRLSELPLGLIGIAIATVVLPSLSKDHSADNPERFNQTLDWAIRVVCLLGVPAGLALLILAEPLIITIFFHGEMTEHDVLMSAQSLRAYAVGLLAFMLVKILAPGFFARQNTRKPVEIAIKAMVANMVFNLCLVFWLAHVGLALATSLSAWLNAILLFFTLRKEIGLNLERATVWLLVKILLAAALMGVALWWFAGPGEIWLQMTLTQRILQTAILVPLGLMVFAGSGWILGVRPRHFRH